MNAVSKSNGKRSLRVVEKGVAAAVVSLTAGGKTGLYRFVGLGALLGATGLFAVSEVGGKSNRVKLGRVPALDTCTCEAGSVGRRCKHVDGTRKLIELGVL